MLDALERLAHEFIGARAASLGEPWLSTFDPAHLQSQLLSLGFSSAETASADELNERYFPRRSDGLRTGGGTRIMCAIK
jgi:O-methyltransferase involved in polyketide biosynthesis